MKWQAVLFYFFYFHAIRATDCVTASVIVSTAYNARSWIIYTLIRVCACVGGAGGEPFCGAKWWPSGGLRGLFLLPAGVWDVLSRIPPSESVGNGPTWEKVDHPQPRTTRIPVGFFLLGIPFPIFLCKLRV